jgi:hypothetical protein
MDRIDRMYVTLASVAGFHLIVGGWISVIGDKVGEVRLPALVGEVGLEADVGGTGRLASVGTTSSARVR